MLSEPRLEMRSTQPYAAIRKAVKMAEIGPVLPPLHDAVQRWLTERGIVPTGAPFFRYLEMDMDADRFVVDVGWPMTAALDGDGEVIIDALPAGRYGVILNTGPFSDLVGAHYALLKWGEEQGIRWEVAEGIKWSARVEHYITDPAEEPDPQKWETEVAFLVGEN